MNAEEALYELMQSQSYSDFRVRRARLEESVKDSLSEDVKKKVDQQELVRRRDDLVTRREARQRADAAAVNAQQQADAAKAEAEARWKRAVEAPMFSEAQKKFVREAEFLLYLKTLDTLILGFDRSNTFNLARAIDATISRLTTMRAVALISRETLGAIAAVSPDAPRKLFRTLIKGTFIRYIRWQAALDLDK
jgi:regulator of protease activity HflC (stomatin/prohibitin superfamily)